MQAARDLVDRWLDLVGTQWLVARGIRLELQRLKILRDLGVVGVVGDVDVVADDALSRDLGLDRHVGDLDPLVVHSFGLVAEGLLRLLNLLRFSTAVPSISS